jgi:hypothetical protein
MKHFYLFLKVLGFIFLLMSSYHCGTDHGYEALDIVTQREDLEQMYYNQKFIHPTIISGKIIDALTHKEVAGAEITARLDGSDTQYKTNSKTGGLYKLCVEGAKNYIIYVTMSGYEKKYYISSNFPAIDSIMLVNNDSYFDFELNVPDHIPVFTINYITSYTLSYYLTSLTYNGLNLAGINNSSVYEYNSSGTIVGAHSIKTKYLDIIASQDTFYWVKDYGSKVICKVGQKSGITMDSFYFQKPFVDFEIMNNFIWLESDTELYKLSTKGDQLACINLSVVIPDLSLIGITKYNNYLYLLNHEKQYDNIHKGYSIYKFDPITNNIVSKGYLPNNFEYNNLTRLAADGVNFWIIRDYSSFVELLKFSIIE